MATAKLRSPLLFIIPFYHFFFGGGGYLIFKKSLHFWAFDGFIMTVILTHLALFIQYRFNSE